MNHIIMSVDDFQICHIILRKLLSLCSDRITLSEFTDPVEAFNQIAEINPDLIFLDLNMPALDGWQFLERMAENEMKARVIILTSSTSKSDIGRYSQFSNVIDYQVKPITKVGMDTILAKYLTN